MAYPWPSISEGSNDFLFERAERPILGTDTNWQPSGNFGASPVLGGLTSGPILLGFTSERAFDALLRPSRLQELRAWIGRRITFTDWSEPTPDSRSAMIMAVAFQEIAFSRVGRGTPRTRELHRVRIELQGL